MTQPRNSFGVAGLARTMELVSAAAEKLPRAEAEKSKLAAYRKFLDRQGHRIELHPAALIPIAHSLPEDDPVRSDAIAKAEHSRVLSQPWLRLLNPLPSDPEPALLRTLMGHTHFVTCVARLDADRIVSGSHDGTLRVWSLREGRCERVLEGHTRSVSSVAVLPDGRIVSGSHDWTIRIWNSTTGECEVVYPCECEVLPVAVRQLSQTETRLAVGLLNGRVLFFNVRNLK